LVAGEVEGRDPLRRIDAVMMNKQGDGQIAIVGGVGDPASRMRLVPLAKALNTPVQESSQRVETALQDPARNPQAMPQQQEPQRAAGQAR
jgi:hypothetical protein